MCQKQILHIAYKNTSFNYVSPLNQIQWTYFPWTNVSKFSHILHYNKPYIQSHYFVLIIKQRAICAWQWDNCWYIALPCCYSSAIKCSEDTAKKRALFSSPSIDLNLCARKKWPNTTLTCWYTMRLNCLHCAKRAAFTANPVHRNIGKWTEENDTPAAAATTPTNWLTYQLWKMWIFMSSNKNCSHGVL